MNREHVISKELLTQAQSAFLRYANWIAYNTIPYFLEKGDMFFFKEQEEAREFSDNNISEYDDFRIIYAQSVNELVKQVVHGEKLEHELSINKNVSIMNEKNYDFLSNQLKYTGFGEDLKAQLREKMESGQSEFVLTHTKDFGDDSTAATLQFRKSDESDMYFFNRYNLMLKNAEHPDTIKQTFYINQKADNITLKEGYNLMCGRSVHKELTTKEGEKYNAWVQIDFKETDKNGNCKLHQYNQNYGFDLQKALHAYPIKEMIDADQKEKLIQSLERGNRQSVTMEINGQERKLAIEAVPRFKAINIYDVNGQRIKSDKLYESNNQQQSEKQEKKQNQKQDAEDDVEPKQQKNKPKRKRQSIS
ncbi:MAG: hypothetical protein ABI675_14535 [Chitinophagaceae bacterium]